MNKYQEIIDLLCEKYSIPSIPVRVCEPGKLGGLHAYFDTIEYFIEVEPDTSAKHIIHEWTHYCINLIANVNQLEEELCDLVPDGLFQEFDEYEATELSKKVKELDAKPVPKLTPLNNNQEDCVTYEEV